MAQLDHDGNSQLPLRGVVLCCTSLPQDARTKVADVSVQMGAVHKLDLTSDVTHLVVGDVTTPKYRYVAKERPDIRVLHVDWLEAVRQTWMEGGDVDMRALEQEHSLPTFFGLQICVTGFDDLQQRNLISDTVQEQGARYHGDLTKQVSHLIAAAPQGAKYTHAKQWGINVVSLRWFQDSLRRGMALEESLYDPVLPVDGQGIGAFKTVVKPRSSLGKRARESESQDLPSEDPSKRRLRRTASTRLTSQSQDMWQDISAAGSAITPSEADQWQDSEVTIGAEANKPAARKQTEVETEQARASSEPGGLFAGYYVHLYGFERQKARRLQEYLEANGATILQHSRELDDSSAQPFFRRRCLMVPQTRPDAAKALPDVPPGTAIATEWWVERCLQYRELLSPEDDILSQPLWVKDMPELAKLTICTTGFQSMDLRQTAMAVQLIGATYKENLVPSASVLVSATGQVRKEKGLYASKHSIPVVTADWLWDSLKNGRKAQVQRYRVSLPVYDPKQHVDEPSAGSLGSAETVGRPSGISGKVKDEIKAQRLSNSRRRHATPSLPLQAPAPQKTSTAPKRESKPRQIFEEEDEDDDGGVAIDDAASPMPQAEMKSPRQSQPLQELSPNKSPQKRRKSADTEYPAVKAVQTSYQHIPQSEVSKRSVSPDKESSAQPTPPIIRPREEVAADLQSILARQAASVTSRPGSAASNPSPRRKSKPLGRAASGLSHRSLSASAQSNPSLIADECSANLDGSFAVKAANISQAPLSTQLGYETHEAEAHRLQMGKRMGAMFADESAGRRVGSIGTVKDAEVASAARGHSAVGSRVRGRHRATKP